MLIPEMLPDEIGRGYLGRLRAINGFRSAEETVRALRLFLGERGRGRESIPIAVLLAKALHMPAEVFFRQHSMLPYTRAVTINLPDMRHGAAGSEAVIRKRGMSLPQSGVYICRSCVTEDMDFWGGAYFRRSHQLPGVPCCENHREGKETTFERTRRLLYVCCSRAGRDLAVVFFADDPSAAHAAIAGLGLFPAEDVHNLAAV